MEKFKLEGHRLAEQGGIDGIRGLMNIGKSGDIKGNIVDMSYATPDQDIVGDFVSSQVANILYITQDTQSEIFFGLLYILTKKLSENNNGIEGDYEGKYYKMPRVIIEELRLNSGKLQTILSQGTGGEYAKITLIKV